MNPQHTVGTNSIVPTSMAGNIQQAIPEAATFQGPSTMSPAEMRVLMSEQVTMGGPVCKSYIRNSVDFEEKLKTYLRMSDTSPENAGDIPEDPESWRELVRLMVEAMVNLRGALDAGEIPVDRIKRLSPFELELKAGELISQIRLPGRTGRNRPLGQDLAGAVVPFLHGPIPCCSGEAHSLEGHGQRPL